MKTLRALRALWRVEWRQLRRHPRRSLLVLVLIAVPVAAIVGGSGLARFLEPSAEQRAVQAMGRADLRIEGIHRWQDHQEILDLLPEDTPTVRGVTGLERVSVPGRRLRAKLIALPADAVDASPTHGPAAGMVRLLAGRAPANAGEVALSPTLLDGLQRGLGDTVTLEYGAPRTIRGIVVEPEQLDLPVVLRVPAAAEYPGRHFLLAGLPGGGIERAAEALRAADFQVLTRDDAAVSDGTLTAIIFALGTIGLFEAALVISAAFGVSLRRRQVEIGLLGATGATARSITASLLMSAAMLALIGGVAGSVLGLAALAAIHPWLEGWTHRLAGPLPLMPGRMIGAIALGALAAILAAFLPARHAAQLSIRQALAGRRPTTEHSNPTLVAGLLMIASGIALMVMATHDHNILRGLGVTLGPIFSIIGFGTCCPGLLHWTAGRAARLSLPWRLAIRDAGRFRERSGAVVTAVLAGMAMSVTLAALVASLETAIDAFPAQFRDDHLLIEGPGAEAVAREIAGRLDAVAATPLRAAYIHGEPVRGRFDAADIERRSGWLAVGDETLLRALGAEAGIDDMRTGRLLALDVGQDIASIDFVSWVGEQPVPLPDVVRMATGQRLNAPIFVLGTGALEAHGLETGPPPRHSLIPWLLRLDQAVTPDQLEQARELAAMAVRTTVDARLLHAGRFRGVYYVVLLLCASTGALVVITATALSAAESAADEQVLHTVGAAPSLLRRHNAARAGYLALVGCVLAIPAGLLAAAAMFGAVNIPVSFVMPWRDLLVIAVGLPALIYSGTWLFGRPGLNALAARRL